MNQQARGLGRGLSALLGDAPAVASGTATDVRSLMLLAPAGFGPDIDTGFTEGFARASEVYDRTGSFTDSVKAGGPGVRGSGG